MCQLSTTIRTNLGYSVNLFTQTESKKTEEDMESAVKTLILGFNPKIIAHQHTAHVVPYLPFKRTCFSVKTGYRTHKFGARGDSKNFSAVDAVSSGAEDIEIASSQYDDFSVTTTSTDMAAELKITVEVSGAKTQEIFDEVFSRMVTAAQPIPGFRRAKGDTKRHSFRSSWTFQSLQGSYQENNQLYHT
ncbi:unnamed protein product [Ilex paraguariensis]|uniref:Uncharacterized protein n=1 Tax=Ilex paraguariensis TaxID=185542 RepID=A0ABC8RUW5_9AQUA